ncbi:MAG TPA: hypothetical protein VFC19_49595 [Candidatus Limnocylindrales bacterium]|nr:hypothetical protein [Candidatus Limnocylindrales bacterium]
MNNSIAYADQLDAASRDALRQLAAMATIDPTSQLAQVPLPVGSWLRDQIAGVIACLEADTADYCEHIGASPQVMFTAAWRPARLVCLDCVQTLRSPTQVEDFTCDQCHQQHDTIHTRVTAIGPVLFAYGRCTGCLNPLTGN